jgi:glutathione S-transferase
MHPFDRNPAVGQMVDPPGGPCRPSRNPGGHMKITPGLIWIGWITLVTLLFYIGLAFATARQRGHTGVPAPATTGHPDFERIQRIHMNTLEYLVPFLVLLWLCAVFWEPLPAAILGILWLFGRIVYAVGYWSAPQRRYPGFFIAMVALILLFAGTAYGLIRMGLVMGV